MKSSGKELQNLQELSIELLETSALVASKMLEFVERNHLDFPERRALGHLLKRAASLLHEMGVPLAPSIAKLVTSDASCQNGSDRRPLDDAIECLERRTPLD